MKNLFSCLILMLLLSSCATTKREYNRSNTIATYVGMGNELQDGILVLKENGYFRYYEKSPLLLNLRTNEHFGHYSRKNDTIFLDWQNVDPKNIKYYLSNKCIVKESGKSIIFVEEVSNGYLWNLQLTSSK